MFNSSSIVEILMRLPALFIAFTIHEFSHGLAAYKFGDLTAKHDGRLSLNPIRHIDPVGFICLLLFQFGWAKPVMVNPSNLKNPKIDMAFISFAGPISNLLLAFIFVLIYYPLSFYMQSNGITIYVFMFLIEFIFLNLSLAVFNLLPIPPLDGSKFFTAILPNNLYFAFLNVTSRFGYLILMLLVWSGATSKIISPIINAVINGMFYLAHKIYFFL